MVTPNVTGIADYIPASPGRCLVDGAEVVELAVHIKPVAFLVTIADGTHEVSRCFYSGDRFTFGPDLSRLGALSAERVEYRTREGLTMTFTKGYTLFVPTGHCQATWRR